MSRLRTSSLLAAAVVALLGLSACTPPSNEPDAYNDVTEANFVEGCTGIVTEGTAEGAATSVVAEGATEDVCKCEYNWFVDNLPFDQKAADEQGKGPDGLDFEQLNEQLQDDPTSMPQDVQDDLRTACVGGSTTPGTAESQGGPTGTPSDTANEVTTSTSS